MTTGIYQVFMMLLVGRSMFQAFMILPQRVLQIDLTNIKNLGSNMLSRKTPAVPEISTITGKLVKYFLDLSPKWRRVYVPVNRWR